jgi:hypothetical protein
MNLPPTAIWAGGAALRGAGPAGAVAARIEALKPSARMWRGGGSGGCVRARYGDGETSERVEEPHVTALASHRY